MYSHLLTSRIPFAAVFPLRMLRGKMKHCVGLKLNERESIISKLDCMDLGGDWIRKDFHYDNIFYSLLNLFIIASCEGWSYFVEGAKDAVGRDIQPMQDYSKLWSLFFILYFLISNIMVFNAFTGVMVEKFNEINEKFGNQCRDSHNLLIFLISFNHFLPITDASHPIIPIKEKKFLNKNQFKF